MRVCFYQVFHPVGQCKTCLPDEFNQNCPNYIPITLWEITVKGGEDEKIPKETEADPPSFNAKVGGGD